VWASELLTELEIDFEENLNMILDIVDTGESKPDNPNIAEYKKVLGYLKPLLEKIKSGEGKLELLATEGGQLDTLLSDARENRDKLESECADELDEARQEGLEDYDLSDEARQYRQLEDYLYTLKALSKRLNQAKFPWPKQYED
jgi:hypothetical protein